MNIAQYSKQKLKNVILYYYKHYHTPYNKWCIGVGALTLILFIYKRYHNASNAADEKKTDNNDTTTKQHKNIANSNNTDTNNHEAVKVETTGTLDKLNAEENDSNAKEHVRNFVNNAAQHILNNTDNDAQQSNVVTFTIEDISIQTQNDKSTTATTIQCIKINQKYYIPLDDLNRMLDSSHTNTIHNNTHRKITNNLKTNRKTNLYDSIGETNIDMDMAAPFQDIQNTVSINGTDITWYMQQNDGHFQNTSMMHVKYQITLGFSDDEIQYVILWNARGQISISCAEGFDYMQIPNIQDTLSNDKKIMATRSK